MDAVQDLKGKVALVTGGAQGIGKACGEILACHGAKVILVDCNKAQAQKNAVALVAKGYQADSAFVDTGDPDAVKQLIAWMREQFERLDILVNNAGVVNRTPVDTLTVSQWDQIIGINLRGVHLMCQYCGEWMKENRRGSIINISSLAGRIAGRRTSPDYVASKGGVIAMTKSYALQYAPWGIRVNGVAPGLIVTPMTEGRNKPEDVPVGRLGLPEDIAGPVYFLASKLSDYMIGVTIDVNGGLYMP